MKTILPFLVLLLTLCSCKTVTKVQREIVYQYEEIHDTIRDVQVQIVRDSIYLHDSIVVTKDVEGKVVYQEKYVYRDLWHDAEVKIVHDSIVVYKDSKDSNIDVVETITEKPWYLPLVTWGSIGFLVCLLLFTLKKLL